MKSQGQLSIVIDDVPWQRQQEDLLQPIPASSQRKAECKIECGAGFMQPKTRFVLCNNQFLLITAEKNPQQEQVINLAYLHAEPSITQKIIWHWLSAAAGAITLTALAAWLEFYFLGLVFLLIGSLCALQFYDSARKRYVFHTCIGGMAVLDFSFHLYDRHKTGHKWIHLLQRRIVSAAKTLPKGDDRLRSELAEHRRLLAGEIISQKRYELAKQRILKRFSKQAA